MISIWLTPSGADRDYLQKIILNLALQHDAPLFSPHCTLFSPFESVKLSLEEIFRKVKLFPPVNVTALQLSYSSTIWKTVFIELKKSSNLTKLNRYFESLLLPSQPKKFSPHISLIYKKMDAKIKRDIIEKLSIKDSYLMNKVTAMKTGPDVTGWEIKSEVYLSG